MPFFKSNTLKKVSLWTKWSVFYLAVLSTNMYICCGDTSDFTIVELAMDWMDALAYCKALGFDGLAIVDTKEKMDTVFNMDSFKSYQDYWVGLQQRDKVDQKVSTFKWDFAMATPWIQWNDDMPDLASNSYCGFVESHTEGISSAPCNEAFYLICELKYEINAMPAMDETTEATVEQTTWTSEATETTVMASLSTRANLLAATIIAPIQPLESIAGGFFPVIYKDKNFQTSYRDHLLTSRTKRSDIECVTVCASQPTCLYTVYVKSRRHCETYSSAIIDESYTFVTEIGTTIRERHAISRPRGDYLALPPSFPVLNTPEDADLAEI